MTLYGALAVHIGLAAWKLAHRRTWRMAPWEAVQIALGLSIPFLAVAHVAVTRGLNTSQGLDDSYTVMLRLLWPSFGFDQSLLIVIVWLHAIIGLHQWLRTKNWYEHWKPALLVLAALVPTVSITGWIEGARRLALKPAEGAPMSEALVAEGGRLIEAGKAGVWTVFWGLVAVIVLLRMMDWFRRGPTITYPGGRAVRGSPGATVLEISRVAGVPHAAVCGGRGRCTTCRVLVTAGLNQLPAPNANEAAALDRINAPPGVRLACQIRPEHSLTIRPLIPIRDAEPTTGRDAYQWGVERRITVMFSDLRGFTTLAERLYPYDSVFLLNRYFEVMSEAINRHGGEVDKFLGDGIMALFGVAPARGAGSADALHAARDMLVALDRLNREFEATLSDTLRIGIGIHMGSAVLGRVGAERQGSLTALGDSVNIASRLEALNKEFGSVIVVSEAALEAAKLTIEGADFREVPVRGREEGLRVAVAHSLDGLRVAEAAPVPA
ncbi:MAG: Adenylate cyclase [uncultured Microvirga sp.]|uniref:Adenylate cyclase n=1 Tax=uncultured Microvirga sp. TaxID=412392 RepID=A0A6J4LFT6_9HYPH|nr:MAG: Adenylate cyclase [uncultured Microvirga sp.]